MQVFSYEINPLYEITCSGDGLAERSAAKLLSRARPICGQNSLALVLIVSADLVLLS